MNDFRHAFRTLGKTPGFAAIVILTMALGIGANTAIFAVVHSVLLRPLPFANADRLVWLWGKFRLGEHAAVAPADFLDYRARAKSFARVGAFVVVDQPSNLASGNQPPVQVSRGVATSGLFDALGVRPLRGRLFTPADEQTATPQVALITESLWRDSFGADDSIAGRRVRLDSSDVTIAGVVPDEKLIGEARIWIVFPFQNPEALQRAAHFLRPIALLGPGVTLARAQAEMDTLASGLEREHPDTNRGWRLRLQSVRQVLLGDTRPALLVLSAAVALLLLIACANVANLLLARGTARRREMAVRAALGAPRSRIIRQLLSESVLLAVAGGVAALLLASWMLALVHTFLPADLPRAADIRMDWQTLVFTFLLAAGSGLLFGAAPALDASRADLREALNEGGRSRGSGLRTRFRNGLVIAEVSLSVMLLIAGGLLVRSLSRLLAVPPGFDGSVLTARLVLPFSVYDTDARRAAFFDRVLPRLKALPGVSSTAIVSELPLSGQLNDTFFDIDGHAPAAAGQHEDANFRVASPGYFQALRVPLLMGRPFSASDSGAAPAVVIVNQPFVHRYFRDANPIGRRISIMDDGRFHPREIVGVVGAIHHFTLRDAAPPEMYVPASQNPPGVFNLVIRAAGDPALTASGVRDIMTRENPDLAVASFDTLNRYVADSTSGDRFNTLLIGSFALLALGLAAAGVYGVVSRAVTDRTREIGVRIALGATRREVLSLVLRQSLTLAIVGVAIGLALAAVATRLLQSLLFGVSPEDPLTFAASALVLVLVALLAAWTPALRATKVDPMVALRYE